jgi:hypothetical protein
MHHQTARKDPPCPCFHSGYSWGGAGASGRLDVPTFNGPDFRSDRPCASRTPCREPCAGPYSEEDGAGCDPCAGPATRSGRPGARPDLGSDPVAGRASRSSATEDGAGCDPSTGTRSPGRAQPAWKPVSRPTSGPPSAGKGLPRAEGAEIRPACPELRAGRMDAEEPLGFS